MRSISRIWAIGSQSNDWKWCISPHQPHTLNLQYGYSADSGGRGTAPSQSKLTELKSSSRVRCSADGCPRARVAHRLQSLPTPTWLRQLERAPRQCVRSAHYATARSCGAGQVCRGALYVYICRCQPASQSQCTWLAAAGCMQHSARSLQCQATPSGCEHLVNRL